MQSVVDANKGGLLNFVEEQYVKVQETKTKETGNYKTTDDVIDSLDNQPLEKYCSMSEKIEKIGTRHQHLHPSIHVLDHTSSNENTCPR